MRKRLAGMVVIGAILATMPAMARPLDMGAWLVDLGRDYPRTPQAGLSDADAEITLLLMQAASRVDPTLSDAYLWQYDMLAALGRDDAARTALERYVEREPKALSARLNVLAMQIDQLQTAESRADFCRAQLGTPNLPGPVASDLHRRLAEFHHNRGETDKAITEARAAVQAYEFNLFARRMLDALQSTRKPQRGRSASRLDELLFGLSASPGDASRAFQAAESLMLMNLPEPADRLYAHAVAVLELYDPQGDLPEAITGRILSLRALGKTAEADAQVKRASEAWQKLLSRMAGTLDAERTAAMAWFYVYFDPKPTEAEKLARAATFQDPDLVMGHRALGAALRLLGRTDDAKAELSPIAGTDVPAAVEYAQLLAAGGDTPGARQALVAAASQPADPFGASVLAQARTKLGVVPPASEPAPAEVRQAVARFNWAVLDYPLHPDKYLSLTLETPRRQCSPGEPWPVTARLRNIGAFPITVGIGMMVRPDLLLSVDMMGDQPRTTGPNIHLFFSKTAVLAVGETAEVTGTLELGAIHRGMIGTPQMTQDVTVKAVLSPLRVVNEQGQELWPPPDVGGLNAEPIRFRRVPFLPDTKNLADLQKRLQSGEPGDRVAAMELFAMLLAESQHIAAGRLQYTARPIDQAAVQAAVLSRVDDPDWQVRARLTECLRWFELKPEVKNVGARLLQDPHWLVRGLAMRAMADHDGSKFQTVLTRASQVDPEEWVRQLTAALNTRITAATPQPASQPEEVRSAK